jgi:hypothetical protein
MSVCLVLEGEEGQGSRRVGSVPVRSAVLNGAAGDHYAACIYNTGIGMLGVIGSRCRAVLYSISTSIYYCV